MSPYNIAVILALVSPLSGCGLDAIEGRKSDFQTMVEDRQALAMPVIATAAVVTPIIEAVADVPAVQVPPCFEEFRIRHCVDGQAVEW